MPISFSNVRVLDGGRGEQWMLRTANATDRASEKAGSWKCWNLRKRLCQLKFPDQCQIRNNDLSLKQEKIKLQLSVSISFSLLIFNLLSMQFTYWLQRSFLKNPSISGIRHCPRVLADSLTLNFLFLRLL